jgi:hypothetical protein
MCHNNLLSAIYEKTSFNSILFFYKFSKSLYLYTYRVVRVIMSPAELKESFFRQCIVGCIFNFVRLFITRGPPVFYKKWVFIMNINRNPKLISEYLPVCKTNLSNLSKIFWRSCNYR